MSDRFLSATPTVLIVDDTPGNLGVMVGFLEDHGYRVAVAQDGAEGLARATLVLPDLILLDVMMPDLDGFEVCRRLKAQPATADIPVIFMTALTDTEHKVAGFRAGGVDYITKPLQIDEVLARVDTHLKIHLLQRQLNAKNEELVCKVAARTAELTAANEALKLKSYALNQVGEAAYLIDENARFLYVNDESCRALGYCYEELIGMTVMDIDPDWTVDRWIQTWNDTLITKHFNAETIHCRKDGSVFPVEIHTSQFEYLGKNYNLALARDITERKAMENELREKEGRYRGIFDNIGDTLYLLEVMPDGRFRNLEVNPAFEKSSGMSSQELVGKCIEETVPKGVAHMVNQKYRRCIVAGVPTDEEITINLPSGLRRYHSTLVPVRDVSGRIHRIVGISRDITEHKEVERKLEESLNLLRQLSARRDAVREEERKHIAREIHDELGQMLTAQRLDIATLKFQFGEKNPILAERCQRMLKIADQTLLTVRGIATSLRPAALDMGIVPALEWLITEFRQRTGTDCQIQLDTMDLSLDEEQAVGLFRIVQESLTNVTRHAESCQVIVVLSSDMDAYQLTIQDNGKGFTPNDNNVRSFGLVGIYERALMLGGVAEIESSPGHGTTVYIRIPHHRQKDA